MFPGTKDPPDNIPCTGGTSAPTSHASSDGVTDKLLLQLTQNRSSEIHGTQYILSGEKAICFEMGDPDVFIEQYCELTGVM
jgi:hypothetical protein